MRSAEPMPQTNHFLHADMVERQFDQSDGHYTPSFGKWLGPCGWPSQAALAEAAPRGGSTSIGRSSSWPQRGLVREVARKNGQSAEPRVGARLRPRAAQDYYGQSPASCAAINAATQP
jgi:hypothetical protein